MKHSLKQLPDTIASVCYYVRKIEAVLDRIIAECTAIAVGQAEKDLVDSERVRQTAVLVSAGWRALRKMPSRAGQLLPTGQSIH